MTSVARTVRSTFWTHHPSPAENLRSLAPTRDEPVRVRPRARLDLTEPDVGAAPIEPRRRVLPQ